jgi:pyruvate,water dikinase
MNKLLLKGSSACLGIVKGKVKIISDANSQNIEKGDILVTEMTTPRYIHLIKNAGAIVTDIGGMLCHAAIVSREFNIPCIVGTEKATTTLKDGQIVIVNANEGKVYEE